MKRTLKKFDDFDVLRVFLVIGESGTVKRMDICYRTLIGEGSVKNILKSLSEKGMIDIHKKGNELTERGREIFNRIRKELSDIKPVGYDVFHDGYRAYASVLKNYDKSKTKNIYSARDHAIRIGCQSAMVLVNKDGLLRIPYFDGLEYNELCNEFDLEDEDLMIVVSAGDKRDSEKGVLSITQYLNEELGDAFLAITGEHFEEIEEDDSGDEEDDVPDIIDRLI